MPGNGLRKIHSALPKARRAAQRSAQIHKASLNYPFNRAANFVALGGTPESDSTLFRKSTQDSFSTATRRSGHAQVAHFTYSASPSHQTEDGITPKRFPG